MAILTPDLDRITAFYTRVRCLASGVCWIRDPSLRDLHAPTTLEGDLTDLAVVQ